MDIEYPFPQTPDVDHMFYPRVEDRKEADGMAWVFKDAKQFVPYYFKFPDLGEGEVRAKVLYTGLCHSDVMTVREKWGPCNFPCCPGHEVVGEIIRVGSEVKDLKVGDRVGFGPFRNACFECKYCKRGDTNLCEGIDSTEKLLYGLYFGGYATHIQVPHTHSFKLPAGIDIANVSPVLCAGCTVYPPMKRHVKEAGASIGVIGIGGLGHLAVQYAKALGLKVGAFTTSENKVESIKKLGADEVILVDKEMSELKKHTGKFDYLINTLPVNDEASFAAYVMTMANGGTLIQVGAPEADNLLKIGFGLLITKQISIVGSAVSSVQETRDTLEFTAKHGIKVQVEEFMFEDFPKAFDRLENGKPQFRCVVKVEDFVNKYFPVKH